MQKTSVPPAAGRRSRDLPRRARDARLPALVAAVLVLLLNDHVLKAALGTWWTGKLSDVAGLFAFALFWSLLFPRRRWWIAAATAVGFVAWKSPASQPLIDGLNGLLPVTIGRVVDWTDLVALAVLPAAAWLAARGPAWPIRRARDLSVAGLSLFAFAATTPVEPEPMYGAQFSYLEPYGIGASQERTAFALADNGAHVQLFSGNSVSVVNGFMFHDCEFVSHSGLEPVDADSSTVRLMSIDFWCVQEPEPAIADSLALRTAFEDSVVAPLRTLIGGG